MPFDENIRASSQINLPLSAATSSTSVVYNGNKNGPSSGSSAQSLTSILSKGCSNTIQSNEIKSRKEEADVVSSSSVGSTGSNSSPSSGVSALSHKPRLSEGQSNIIQPKTELVTAIQFDENLSREEKVDVLSSSSSVGSNKNNRSSGSSILLQRPTLVATTSVSPTVAPVETMSVEQFQDIANGLLERVESAVNKLKDYRQGIAGAEKESAVATPVVPSAAISVSSHPPLISIASLTSSVQVQQRRIEQFEADALHKHREAELAAASAREALDVMVKIRNDRREKVKAREDLGDGEKDGPTKPEVKSGSMCSSIGNAKYNNFAGKTELQPKHANEGSTPCRDGDVYSAASASQNSRQENNHGCQSSKFDTSGSNNANRKSDTQQFEDDGDVGINDSADESTIDDSSSDELNTNTSTTYLSKLRGVSEERQRTLVQSSQRRSKHRVTESIEECPVDNDNHTVMKGAGSNHRSIQPRSPRGYNDDEDTISESSERKSSIADSVSSKSTISTFDSSRHRRSLSASNVRRSERVVSMKPHLLLPSLTSADPVDPSGTKESVEYSTPTRTSTTNRHSVQRTSSQNPSYSQSIPSSRSSLARTSQSMKPNHLLPYSPRRGYMDATSGKGARFVEARMPEPLSRRTESEPFARDHHQQRPMMSQHLRELHSSDEGYGLPGFLPKGQYSNSLVDSSSLISAKGVAPFRHSLSLTPMSLHEREQFGFNTQQPRANPHTTPNTFDASMFAQHQTFGERKASTSQEVMAPIPERRPSVDPRPTTRDFDSLLLAQHQRIEERMGSNNQETMARERPSGIVPPMTRDFDSLLLAQNQIIGERMAAANQETMAREQQPSDNPRSTTRGFNSLLFAHDQMIGEPMAPVNQQTMTWQHVGGAPAPAAGTTQPFATGEYAAYMKHEAVARQQFSGASAAVMAYMDQHTMAPQHFVGAYVATAATGGQPFMTGERHNAPIAAGYHHPTMLSSHSSHTGRFGNNANRKSDTQQFGDDGGVGINDSADESTIDNSSFDELSTTSSYLSKLRGVSEDRRRTLVQRSHIRSKHRVNR